MRKKYRRILLAAAMALFFTCGCSEESLVTELSETTDDGIQIGITFDSFIIERWQRDRDLFVSAAGDLGAEVNVQSANGDLLEQVKQIDYFIDKHMDAIVIVQVASDDGLSEFLSAVERAKKAGIPVICYDRLILDADVDLYISFDNVEVGRLMAEHMREHLGDGGTIIRILGPLADYNVPQVMSGFDEVTKESDIDIDLTEYADLWLAETAFDVTNSYLYNHKAPDGIMCGNDSLAGQAIKALSERRLAGRVCVVGQDADLDACQRIVEGTQCMTVYKPVEKLARRAAELAVAFASGEKPDIRKTISDGTYEVPYESITPVMVTKDNMDEIITGKYHEESDIYLNVRR